MIPQPHFSATRFALSFLRLALFAVVAIVFVPLCAAKTVRMEQAGLTVEVPSVWRTIPAAVLTEAVGEARKAAPATAAFTFILGLQAQPRADWFEPPYVMVQVDRSGRRSERTWLTVDASSHADTARQAQRQVGNIVAKMALNEVRFDRSTGARWLRTEVTAVNGVKVHSAIAVIPTEYGSVTLHGYAFDAGKEGFFKALEEVVRSARLSPEVRYRWRSAE